MSTVSLIAPQSLLWTEDQGLGRKPAVRAAVDACREPEGSWAGLGLAWVFVNLTQARVTWEEEPLLRTPPPSLWAIFSFNNWYGGDPAHIWQYRPWTDRRSPLIGEQSG